MDVREKLVELLDEAEEWADHKCDELDCETCYAGKMKGNCVQKLMVDRLIDHGVTVQEWHSVNECMPEDLEENKGKKVINCIVEHDPYGNKKTTTQFRQRKYDSYYKEWHWSKIGGCTVTRWTTMPQPPKGE